MHRQTVIVVEDEPMNRLIAVDVLEEAGFEVIDFSGADDALSYAETAAPVAALFTDINVPGDRDGIELAIEFARRWPEIVVLVTSGRFGINRPEELPQSALYVTKPWRGRDIVTLLRRNLGETSSPTGVEQPGRVGEATDRSLGRKVQAVEQEGQKQRR